MCEQRGEGIGLWWKTRAVFTLLSPLLLPTGPSWGVLPEAVAPRPPVSQARAVSVTPCFAQRPVGMPVEGRGPGEAGIHLGLGPRGQDREPAYLPGHPARDVPSWGKGGSPP